MLRFHTRVIKDLGCRGSRGMHHPLTQYKNKSKPIQNRPAVHPWGALCVRPCAGKDRTPGRGPARLRRHRRHHAAAAGAAAGQPGLLPPRRALPAAARAGPGPHRRADRGDAAPVRQVPGPAGCPQTPSGSAVHITFPLRNFHLVPDRLICWKIFLQASVSLPPKCTDATPLVEAGSEQRSNGWIPCLREVVP